MTAAGHTHPICGLYAIADTGVAGDAHLLARTEAVLMGGARIVQYRDKSSDRAKREQQASALLALCREYGALLLINDDVELAATVGAGGVHLGRNDDGLAQARARLGPAAIIGVSCYNEMDRARAAQTAGADYVAFGRFYASGTKPGASGCPIDVLKQAQAELTLPIVAIGGITPDNGAALIAAGADALAVIGGLYAAPDAQQAARDYTRLFKPETEPHS